MNESKKRQHKQLLTLIAIIGYVIVLFMSLHMGTVKALDDSLDIFSVFVQGLTHMSDEPLRIIFSSYTFAYAGLMTLAFEILSLSGRGTTAHIFLLLANSIAPLVVDVTTSISTERFSSFISC